MEQNKLQKIAWAIVPILIIGWVFGYKFYTNYTVKQTNKFIDSYNSFTISSNVLFWAFEAKIDENGKLRNPSEADQVIEKAKKLKDTDCNYITKKEIKSDCINIFSEIENIIKELKEKWISEEINKKLEVSDNKIEKFEKDLTEKLWVKFM